MSFDNLRKQYIDYRRDLKSISPKASIYKDVENKIHLFLKKVHKEHGQEMVNKLISKTNK